MSTYLCTAIAHHWEFQEQKKMFAHNITDQVNDDWTLLHTIQVQQKTNFLVDTLLNICLSSKKNLRVEVDSIEEN